MGNFHDAADAYGESDPAGAEVVGAVLGSIHEAGTPFYGRVTLSFAGGKITHVAKEETFKPLPALRAVSRAGAMLGPDHRD
jgi:hypothetical protein